MVRINLVASRMEFRRAPRPNDPRYVFNGTESLQTFWTFHKRVLAAVGEWQIAVGRNRVSQPKSIPLAEVDAFINMFANGVYGKFSDNRLAYGKAFEGVGDVQAILRDSLHPYVFGSYLKRQMRDALTSLSPTFEYHWSEIAQLKTRLEKALELA